MLNNNFSQHDTFPLLQIAIEKGDTETTKKLLLHHGLLKQFESNIFEEILFNAHAARLSPDTGKLLKTIAHIKAPEMIFTILAAGFSVFDLGVLFKASNNRMGYIALIHMLPGLTAKETNILQPIIPLMSANTMDYPRIAVKLDDIDYDLVTIFDNCNFNNYFSEPLGFKNQKNLHDKLVLNIDSLTLAVNKLGKRTESNIINSIIEHVNQENQRIKRDLTASLKSNKIAGRTANYLACFTAISLLMFYGIYSTTKDYEDSNDDNSKPDKTLLGIYLLLLMRITHINGYIKFTADKIASKSLASMVPIDNKIMTFNYLKAQEDLPNIIAEQFTAKFHAKKPASLLFWQPVFKPLDSSSENQDPINISKTNKVTLTPG